MENRELQTLDDFQSVDKAEFFNENYGELIKEIQAIARADVFDVKTAKGRDALRSHAQKIAKTKTAIDKVRKALTADWRDKTAAVNAKWKTIQTALDSLKEEVRKPLTDWEAEEQRKKERLEYMVNTLEGFGSGFSDGFGGPLSSEKLREKLEDLRAMHFEDFGDHTPLLEDLREESAGRLQDAIGAQEKREEEARELEQLRKEKAERERQEAEERQKQEQAEAEERRRKEAEERKKREEAEAKERAEKVVDFIPEEKSRLGLTMKKIPTRVEVKEDPRFKAVGESSKAVAARMGIGAVEATLFVEAVIKGEIPHLEFSYTE